VHERVVQQRRDDLCEPARREVRFQVTDADHHEAPLSPPEGRLPLHHLLPDDVVHAGQRGGRRPAGRAEQLADDVSETFGLDQRRIAFLTDHVRLAGGGDHLLQPHGQRGQRRTELVRDVHGQLAVRGEQAAEPPGGAVKPVGHLVQITHAVPAAERARVTGAEPGRRLGEFRHRPGQPPGQGDRQPGRKQDRGHQHGYRGRAPQGEQQHGNTEQQHRQGGHG
jgi:hypothetical protein